MHALLHTSRQPARSGFTLLEVLLSIGISIVILSALLLMIDFQLLSLDTSRRRVEEAQLARALMQRMAEDIRAAVRYDPLNFNALVPAAAGSFNADALAEGLDSAGDLASGSGGNDQADESDSQSSSLSAEAPQTIPGLYAGIDQRGLNVLQVDVSRLPRLDEFQQMVAVGPDGRTVDHISDVKTVSYYIHPVLGGLVRRVRSRASEQYALEMGMIDDTGDEAFIIAPEVADLTYRFYDGTQWYYDWNSDERAGLPLAVEITLAFAPPDDGSMNSELPSGYGPSGGAVPSAGPTYGGAGGPGALRNYSLDELRVYRLVVHLPAAEPTTLEGDASTTTEDTQSNSSSSASGGSAGTGGR